MSHMIGMIRWINDALELAGRPIDSPGSCGLVSRRACIEYVRGIHLGPAEDWRLRCSSGREARLLHTPRLG